MRGFGKVDDSSSSDYQGDGSDEDRSDLSDDEQLASTQKAKERESAREIWEGKIDRGSSDHHGLEEGLHDRFQAIRRRGNAIYRRVASTGASTAAYSASATFVCQHRDLPEVPLSGSWEGREGAEGGEGGEGGQHGEGARREAGLTTQDSTMVGWDWLSKATPILLSSEDVGSRSGGGSAEASRCGSSETYSGRSRNASTESLPSMETRGGGIAGTPGKQRKRVNGKVTRPAAEAKVRVQVCSCSACRKLPAAPASS